MLLETGAPGQPPWLLDAGVIASIGSLLAILGGGVVAMPRVIREFRELRRQNHELSAEVGRVKHELHPNSGASMRDSTDRVEAATKRLAEEVSALRRDTRSGLDELRRAVRQHDREIGRLADASEQMRDRITREADGESRRLDDHAERIRALEAAARRLNESQEFRDNP